MKIEKINIKNFKGIDSYEGEINGLNVYLKGPNASNKTSFIDAVWGCLSPKNLPKEPVKNGQKKGLVEIDLGDFIARSKFVKGKAVDFQLENKVFNNETEKFIKSPRTYLANRIGIIDFNITDFFSKTDAEKLKYLAKILDADFSDLDSDIDECMESRKFDKKRFAELTAAVDYYSKEDAEAEIINIVELSKEIALENKKVETFDRVKKGVEDAENQLIELQAKIDAGKLWLLNEINVPIDGHLLKLTDKLENSNTTNKKIQAAKNAKLVDIEVAELETQIEKTTNEIEDLRKKKAEKISKVLKVQNLMYDVEKELFLYNGLPFEANQINTAAQLIAGMQIAATMLKELKIVRVDASMIDKKNFNQVLSWAKENEIELFVEIVDRESEDARLEITVE